ncbi:hypothetical protein NQ314_015724 [Rhamnusium bicolor]|uniref:Uncharacterized protein n=1 Tax=Rhamnusium bicolor TaxID=1586634 RepID=A0AAV8WZ04_9CUCU|nr:hypothetical protein NQ314_015724 [Rhamnusium bicolor]
MCSVENMADDNTDKVSKYVEINETYHDALNTEKHAVLTTTEEELDEQRLGKRKIKKIIANTLSMPLLSDYEIESGNIVTLKACIIFTLGITK